jgi:uncharacterized protein YecE (DUF72 family)
MAGEVRVGTSGWQYADWRGGVVYPEGLGQPRWLGHYASRFPTVEVNATFYRLASEPAVRRWRDAVPPAFEFVLKGSRFITHRLKLRDATDATARFFAPLHPVLDRTPVILWQLPPNWRRDVDRLDGFLADLPIGHRYAVEFRDDDWYHADTYRVLERHGAALVWLSSSLTRSHELVATAGHVYVRFHGLSTEAYRYDYPRAELEPWAARLAAVAASGTPAWAFFNNDFEGHAVHNAEVLVDLLGDAARPWPPPPPPAAGDPVVGGG